MLRLSPPRSTRRVPSWPAVLLACALSVLLLAAVHCSSYLSNDGHRHLSLSAPAVPDGHAEPSGEQEHPDRPQHDHGAACASPCLNTWASANEVQRPADGSAAPSSSVLGVLPVEQVAASAAFGSGRSPIARTGRSTLAGVCRWRI
ncbi:hypothetical protein M8Z33_30860 [Streptomyces sp. ZAF1911]|uniref:hypothetical protein n=1 Tax=Streptomyces sp. ZAF1911 TaxID=2944129 RepID=UPI00237AFBFD|nr:hypothetical protein [Streptomyces sp. ZAF1911]MDD9380975.1 hypothetical protein [Streptomyces sp. ZAF1911]